MGKPTLLIDNKVEPEEYFEFVNACPDTFNQYKVICDIDKINEYLINKFESNEISGKLHLIKAISEHNDLTAFTNYVKGKINGITPVLSNYKVFISDIYSIGKILSNEGKLLFEIPEGIALPLLSSNIDDSTIKIDLILSIIRSNINNPNPLHFTNPHCKAILNEVDYSEDFIKSYEYYVDYDDLIKYALQYTSPLVIEVINKLTEDPQYIVSGTDVDFLINHYDEIHTKILKKNLASFIEKVNSFYNDTNHKFVNNDNLSIIRSLINDNYEIKNQLMSVIISQANDYLNVLDKSRWLEALKKYETSEIIKLFKTLLKTDTYQSGKLSQAADYAYSDIIESIAEKEIAIPSDVDFWKQLFVMRLNIHSNTFKNVRDKVLIHTHGVVGLDELSFFENGLFQYGKLDENRIISDEVLRRIFIPLASSEEAYIKILKNNSNVFMRIVQNANDSIIDFKNALESKCQPIIQDENFQSVWALLQEKFNQLSPKPESNEAK